MSKLTDHSGFTKQFREELIKDLELCESILCPKCNLNYVDNWNENMCRYECEDEDSDSDSEEDEEKNVRYEVRQQSWLTEPGHCPGEVVCVFDFYDTSLKEIIDEWLRKLLRMCGDDEELRSKWQQKFHDALAKIEKK